MDIVKIGRSSDNNEIFAQGEISRHHCELYSVNKKLFIKDLGSSNGTYVNGKRISKPVWLKKGDKVSLGKSVEIDWFNIWKKYYKNTLVFDDASDRETLRPVDVNEEKKSVKQEQPVEPHRPFIDIPADMHIKQEHEHAEVYKAGDDFKVPFKRRLGSNIGNHVGNTLGCVISVIIVVAILAIVGLILS